MALRYKLKKHSAMVRHMASSKKSKKKIFSARHVLVFIGGLALPFSLAVGWHVAYGQQGQKTMQASLSQEGARPSAKSAPTASPQDEPAGKPSGSKTAPASPPREELATMQPNAKAVPAVSPHEELASMRQLFQDMVRKPTLERIDRTKKSWANAPKLQNILEERRQRLLALGSTYQDFIRSDVALQMAKNGVAFPGSQYFVYVDRNPSAQFVTVGFYDQVENRIEFLGTDLVSSGNVEKGGDYFETPTGVFENLVENFSYRAMGTPNQDGWRGLGAKDSRVWDFGDQKSVKKYKEGNTISQMRLLMHSTDPDKGEQRLGRIDSKGCVRISQGLNRFLDAYAILDQNYEEWAKSKPDSWLLKKDRHPVAYPGRYLIIGDSAQALQAQAKQ